LLRQPTPTIDARFDACLWLLKGERSSKFYTDSMGDRGSTVVNDRGSTVVNDRGSTLVNERGSTVVIVLCYRSEGRRFDPSWCHWNFSLT